MAKLPTKSFDQIVSNTIVGIQGRAIKLIDFSEGSTLRAIVEGFAGLFLWFQAMVLQVLAASRLSTSRDDDVDSFTADFMPTIGVANGVPSPRLGPQAATGGVTYSRFTAAPSTCFIPAASSVTAQGVVTNAGATPAATIQTNDGAQNFVVTADASNANYSPSLGGYILQSSIASIIVPVSAVIAGSAGNIQAGTLTVPTSPITGIDAVTNVASFINGADQEADSALKSRFASYILGLSRGDYYGLDAAIRGVIVNVQWKLTESYNFDGSYHPAFFFVVADDGSGNPPNSFMALVTAAAQAVRPLGIQCAVFRPTVLIANVSLQVATLPGYDHNTVLAQVSAKIATSINSLGLGNALPWSIIASWAYAVPGVDPNAGVSAVFINNGTGDSASIKPTKPTQNGHRQIAYATIKCGVINIS